MAADICLWSDLSLADINQLWKCSSRDDIKKVLCKKMQYDSGTLHSKQRILLDLHFHTLLFAKERKYSEEQTSALFSIIKRTHEKAVETPFGNLDETLAYFKELLARHSVKRPPFCIYLFPVQEVVKITEYVVNTYFRHYKLYKYAFTPKIVMNVAVKYADIVDEDPPLTAGVEEGCDPEVEKEDGGTEISNEQISVEPDDPPAIRELKQIVESTLDEQIAKLKLDVDSKLKTNEETVMQQMNSGRENGGKSPSANKGKGKKGK